MNEPSQGLGSDDVDVNSMAAERHIPHNEYMNREMAQQHFE